jgi:hypothetical protein
MALRASLADLRPEELARLTPEQRARLLELAKRIGPAEGLDAFIRRISPHHPPPRHYPILIEQFERARWDRRVRVCISIRARQARDPVVALGVSAGRLRLRDVLGPQGVVDEQGHSRTR